MPQKRGNGHANTSRAFFPDTTTFHGRFEGGKRPRKINMGIKKLLIKTYTGVRGIFRKKPPHIVANIVTLAPNALLEGRCALITGGTAGIGFAIANAMLQSGAAVVFTGRSEERCAAAAKQLTACDSTREGRVFYQVMDVRETEAFSAHLSAIEEKIGNRKIDILCNNAGVQGARFGNAREADFDSVMNTNYKGPFFLSQLMARYMIDRHIEGNILNIASVSANRPTGGAYALSKAAMKEFTMGLAKFLIPHGIVVNGIAPGPTATPMMGKDKDASLYHPTSPMGRYATPEEIANMAVILTSGIGRTVVGDLVYMGGGAGVITFDDCKYDLKL